MFRRASRSIDKKEFPIPFNKPPLAHAFRVCRYSAPPHQKPKKSAQSINPSNPRFRQQKRKMLPIAIVDGITKPSKITQSSRCSVGHLEAQIKRNLQFYFKNTQTSRKAKSPFEGGRGMKTQHKPNKPSFAPYHNQLAPIHFLFAPFHNWLTPSHIPFALYHNWLAPKYILLTPSHIPFAPVPFLFTPHHN
jgi:hypothetical protein